MAGRKRRRASAGTIVMLSLTVLVLLFSVLFLIFLVGGDLYARTGVLLRTLSDQGLFDGSLPQYTPMPALVYMDEDTPAPTLVPATPTPVPQPVTISISAAGTVYAPNAVRESALDGAAYDFEPVFSGLGDTLSDADLSIATLETSAAGQELGYDSHNTAPEILDALRTCGVDLLSLATERTLDHGYEGLDLTLSELTARGLAYTGVDPDGAGRRTTMMRVGGVQVAVLAGSYGLSDAGQQRTNGDEREAVTLLDEQQMLSDIRQARVDGANLVIVLAHWGTKNIAETPVNVRRLARSLAEGGADIILGTHPDVAQGTERLSVTRADGLAHEAVVCYSLGTLLTDARTEENTAGMIAHVSVTYDPVSRRTALGSMYCTPVYIARQREEGGVVYRVVDAESTAAVSALTAEEKASAQQALDIIRSVTQEDGQGDQG